jgi:hypothetical protein
MPHLAGQSRLPHLSTIRFRRCQRAAPAAHQHEDDVEARKALLGWSGVPGHGLKRCSPSLPPSRKVNRSRSSRSWPMHEARFGLLLVDYYALEDPENSKQGT